MEKSNFSIRKCFEEVRKEQNLSLGDIMLTIGMQGEIADVVEAQEKKYKDDINLLLVIIQGLQEQPKVQEANTQDTIAIIDTLQRVVASLHQPDDAIERNRVITKMMNYIGKL